MTSSKETWARIMADLRLRAFTARIRVFVYIAGELYILAYDTQDIFWFLLCARMHEQYE